MPSVSLVDFILSWCQNGPDDAHHRLPFPSSHYEHTRDTNSAVVISRDVYCYLGLIPPVLLMNDIEQARQLSYNELKPCKRDLL